MKRICSILFLVVLLAGPSRAQQADSVDVLDYDLTLDLSAGKPFAGKAVITMQLERGLDFIGLQLYGTTDSLLVDGVAVDNPNLAQVPVGTMQAGVPFTVTVHYHGSGHVESYGWGGFHFDSDMSYNLGVAFNENPHAVGRTMFPCRDNFTDKATYTLRIKSRSGWTAECSGVCQSREVDTAGCEHSVWVITQPTPTYLVSVSQADYHRIAKSVAGYPLTLGYLTQDSARVEASFALLDSVVPMYERCFGPYRWGRIGYIATKQGSMEHVNNIALAREFMSSPSSERGQSTIAHELGHAWFGNLVTCSNEGDMWINEGGATFCSEVAHEAVNGYYSAINYYQTNLEAVLRQTHVTDGRYLALSGMPHSLTYGSTTYDKGALVWHSLRGYLGDTVFYGAMRRLMSDKAFGNIDAAELRDSLSSYTGVDLTDFFAFHVFGAGFVDYHIEMADGMLHIAQQGVGTDNLARSSRVPVTFLDANGNEEKRWYTFSGSDTTVAVDGLPFEPVYCLLDRQCEISDAATRGELHITTDGQRSCSVAHFMAVATDLQRPVDVYIDHHWGKPYGLDTVSGILRTAGRYWTVAGNMDYTDGISGRFKYSRTSQLDRGFYDQAVTLDSMVLMHRWNSRSPWTCVSRGHTSSSEGYFYCRLLPGEYALAVADPATVGIGDEAQNGFEAKEVQLFPNPLAKGEALTVDMVLSEPFTVTIFSQDGRRIWHKQNCHNGQKLHPKLAAGTYLVAIENKFVSLQSKLIQL